MNLSLITSYMMVTMVVTLFLYPVDDDNQHAFADIHADAPNMQEYTEPMNILGKVITVSPSSICVELHCKDASKIKVYINGNIGMNTKDSIKIHIYHCPFTCQKIATLRADNLGGGAFHAEYTVRNTLPEGLYQVESETKNYEGLVYDSLIDAVEGNFNSNFIVQHFVRPNVLTHVTSEDVTVRVLNITKSQNVGIVNYEICAKKQISNPAIMITSDSKRDTASHILNMKKGECILGTHAIKAISPQTIFVPLADATLRTSDAPSTEIPKSLEYLEGVIYPELDYKHTHNPTYCIITPKDEMLGDNQTAWMLSMAHNAILEWNQTLRDAFEHDDGRWQMHAVTVSSGYDNDNTYDCDWTLSFQRDIYSFFSIGVVLGYADTQNREIVITYADLNHEDFHDVLVHEIGHSLGLGHFITDDAKLMLQWLNTESPPSIMVPNIHYNTGLTSITQLDTDKLKEIYGTGGFSGEYETNDGIVKTNREDVQKNNILEWIEISPKIIHTESSSDDNTIIISGKISEESILSGVPLQVVLMMPDLSTEISTQYLEQGGTFETMSSFDSDSLHGMYAVDFVYRGVIINMEPITYVVSNNTTRQESNSMSTTRTESSDNDVILKDDINNDDNNISDENINTTRGQVPPWIKLTAEWWVAGQISDDEFLQAIEFLVNNDIIQIIDK